MVNEPVISDGSDSDDDLSYENTIHPEDLIYCIFLCADDFLRQELIDKMVLCQYAVPFILPSPTETNSRNLILDWAHKSVIRRFYNGKNDVTKTLVDVEAPLVTFMNIGEETSWKSRLLNKMLSSQQETFWHQELKGGDIPPEASCGMVEVAWHLPGGHVNDKFPYPITFANMRGNAAKSSASSQLINCSSLVCLFVEDINKELKEFLQAQSTLEHFLITVSHAKLAKDTTKQEISKLKKEFSLRDGQIILRRAHGSNFSAISERIKGYLYKCVSNDIQPSAFSLSAFALKASNHMELDNKKCFFGEQAAQSILSDIDRYSKNNTASSAKTEILPFQSDRLTRQQLNASARRLYKQQIQRESSVVAHIYHLKREKMNLRLNQLQEPPSDTFIYFLQYLINSNDDDKKYFLQCLKLGLRERPVVVQDKCDITEENNFDLNDFFRELQMLYKNIFCLQKKGAGPVESHNINEMLDLLSGIGRDILMNGLSIEIMNRDSSHVPVKWLTAVFNKMEKDSRQRVFKISALGAKGSGKLNVLSATFGLKIPPSNGTYTKGTHMRLLRIDEPLKKRLKYDCIAVIDCPDLMPESKADHPETDNRLATFVVGLSDMTLLVFTSQGIELQNVLPLSIIVFLRMNVVEKHKACHFIYQNMESMMKKTETETMAFVRSLDAKTLVAAKITDQEDKIKKFEDILRYDITKNITSAPNFLDGISPMGKINSLYANTMQQLKSNILQNMEEMQSKGSKPLATFADFTRSLNELWKAMKYEDLVFTLKNVSCIETYYKLVKISDGKQWKVKRSVRDMISREKSAIEKVSQQGHVSDRTFEDSKNKLLFYITDEIAKLHKEISHYFTCGGCDQCNATIDNRHLISNKSSDFLDSIQHVKITLFDEVEHFFQHFTPKIKAQLHIQQLSKEIDDTLRRRVQQLLQEHKSKAFDRKTLDEVFRNMWTEATSSIISSSPSSKDLFEAKRKGYYHLFLMEIGKADMAMKFEDPVLK